MFLLSYRSRDEDGMTDKEALATDLHKLCEFVLQEHITEFDVRLVPQVVG